MTTSQHIHEAIAVLHHHAGLCWYGAAVGAGATAGAGAGARTGAAAGAGAEARTGVGAIGGRVGDVAGADTDIGAKQALLACSILLVQCALVRCALV